MAIFIDIIKEIGRWGNYHVGIFAGIYLILYLPAVRFAVEKLLPF
ncbi:hypothetical protein [Streptococcus sp. 20-1249]